MSQTLSFEQASGTEALGHIRGILTAASAQPNADPYAWVSDMREVIPAIGAADLNDAAHELLSSIPHDQVHQQLSAAHDYAATGDDLRYSRKLYMIARDSIILAHDYGADERYADLFQISHSLGRIADMRGIESAHTVLAAEANARLARDAITPQPPVQDAVLQRSMLRAIYLVPTLEAPVGIEGGAYHEYRKSFRRTTHALILAAANYPGAEMRQLAIDGVVLNRGYGARKDAMLGTAAVDK